MEVDEAEHGLSNDSRDGDEADRACKGKRSASDATCAKRERGFHAVDMLRR